MKTCYLVGAVPCALPVLPKAGDFVIAADGGLTNLEQAGIVPDLLLGDFDSLTTPLPDLPIQRHPVQKDDTDSALAVKEGLARNCDCFLLMGCLGGALDHSLANLALLAWLAEQGKTAFALHGEDAVTVLHNGTITFPQRAGGRVSVFSLSDVSRGVSIRDLAYGLDNAELTRQVALGVSNHFSGRGGTISVREGTLLIHTNWRNFDFFLDR